MEKNITLSLSHLFVDVLKGKNILHDVSIIFEAGKTHVIMGPNGSGKSTLAHALMGSLEYAVKGKILFGKKDITRIPASDRAKLGIFLAFQSPIAISGVSVINLLRTAYQELHPDNKKIDTKIQNPVLASRWKSSDMTLSDLLKAINRYAALLHIDPLLLTRSIHEGFSGGERKKIEVLQALVLQPKFAIFDEIDTGLDVDALQIVATGIDLLRKNGTGCIIITHYQRLLKYLQPDTVVVIKNGSVSKTGDAALAKEIETKGYGYS
ncbi:MAG: Fe-S cluster assembly ATPase SufC [Candidatus Gottesmanbacteria bacterium]